MSNREIEILSYFVKQGLQPNRTYTIENADDLCNKLNINIVQLGKSLTVLQNSGLIENFINIDSYHDSFNVCIKPTGIEIAQGGLL